MTIEILKSPKKIQEIGTVYPWQNRNFYPSFRWTLCSPFWKSLTQDLTSHWQAGCTTDFLGDTSPPPPSRDLYFCEYYALPSRIFRDLFTRMVQVRLPDCFWWGSSLGCKTVRICAYSSTREQSNKRSRTRLKTESTRPTGVWGLLHALPISLLILREKPTVLQSSSLQVLNRSNELWMPPNVIVNYR